MIKYVMIKYVMFKILHLKCVKNMFGSYYQAINNIDVSDLFKYILC